MNYLIVGAGYTGQPLGEYLVEQGNQVVGTRTKADNSASYPICSYRLGNESDWQQVMDMLGDGPFTCIFTAGPPRMDSNEQSLSLYRECLEQLPLDRLERFVFLSSTSVYGNTNGEWVNETTPADPFSESGQLKWEAEQLSEEILGEACAVIQIRIGGIYGPGRNTAKRYLSDRYRMIGDGEKYSNRIHREDLVRAIALLSEHDQSEIVNVVDRKPIQLSEIISFLYKETGRDPDTIPTITWEEAEEKYSEMRLGLLIPRKKVSSEKLRKDYGFDYRFPTAYHGFRALLKNLEKDQAGKYKII